jgi:thiamine biosynthesis lipoprotein
MNMKFEAIGTQWLIETDEPLDDAVREMIRQRIDEFDQTYSRFRDDSTVAKISEKAGEYDFPTDVEKLVGLYEKLYDVTDGALSPLVGDALVQAGYDKNYSLRPGTVNEIPKWDDVMQWHGTHVTISRPATLDFGAAGKGYLIDIVGELLEKNGHTKYVIDASGDIRTRGMQETIGLENPYDPELVIGAIRIENASLCASATNRRAWGEWHHVIDARTGKPVSDVVATWVTAATTIEADGLATALFFVEPDRLSEWEFEYVRLFADGRIEHSPRFVGELFL